jgi:hypothetical protein
LKCFLELKTNQQYLLETAAAAAIKSKLKENKTTDKLLPEGQNLCRVFNSRSDRTLAVNKVRFAAKRPSLVLKAQLGRHRGSSPVLCRSIRIILSLFLC